MASDAAHTAVPAAASQSAVASGAVQVPSLQSDAPSDTPPHQFDESMIERAFQVR